MEGGAVDEACPKTNTGQLGGRSISDRVRRIDDRAVAVSGSAIAPY
jgi:hypothetical protein